MNDQDIKNETNALIEGLAEGYVELEVYSLEAIHVADAVCTYAFRDSKKLKAWIDEVGSDAAFDKVQALFPKGLRL
jgi:hypothetical protein